jgi:branched-chain amino acid transport system permease protein
VSAELTNTSLPVAGAAAGRRRLAAGALLCALVGGLAALGMLLPVSQSLIVENALGVSLFAVATNLLLGYGGLVSFAQAAFYGSGAYAVTLGWRHWHWSFWVGFAIAPFLGAALAVPIGLISLRTRNLYFALLTLAFSQLFFVLAEKQFNFTGGDDGSFVKFWATQPRHGFLFALAVSTICCLAIWWFVSSPFGLVLRATRENRDRMAALGVNVFAHQLVAFMISGAFCAVAGTLFIVYSQSSYPALLQWTTSGEPVIMSVIGGMFAFLGPVVGAFVYTLGHHVLIQHTTHWQLILGAVLLAIVLLRPDGLAGIASSRPWRRGRSR